MPMATNDSPVGTTVEAEIQHQRHQSRRYREEDDRLDPFEQIARVVIMRRAELGLSQQEVAERMGTTASVISRIESGQHRTSTETLRRLAEALEGRAVFGFEFDNAGQRKQGLVRL
jgi:ribosome-binding protein aMBF1 (putative translation factor)